MVSLLVDTTSFLEAGDIARSAALSVERRYPRATSGLAGSSRMAGSDPNGRQVGGELRPGLRAQLFGYGAAAGCGRNLSRES